MAVMETNQEVVALRKEISELKQKLSEAEESADDLSAFSGAQTDLLLKFGVREVAGQKIG
jgi:hypothetical protein